MKNIARYSSLLAVTTLSLVGVAGLAGCEGGDEVVEVERRQHVPHCQRVGAVTSGEQPDELGHPGQLAKHRKRHCRPVEPRPPADC